MQSLVVKEGCGDFRQGTGTKSLIDNT